MYGKYSVVIYNMGKLKFLLKLFINKYRVLFANRGKSDMSVCKSKAWLNFNLYSTTYNLLLIPDTKVRGDVITNCISFKTIN